MPDQTRYITVPFDTDPATILQTAIDTVQSQFPNWEPSDAQLDFWIMQVFASEAAELRDVASAVPDTVFLVYGNDIENLPPGDAQAANTTTTWTMVDNAGYTIPAGTQVGLRDADNNLIAFQTVADVVVPSGSIATAAGAVQIEAIVPGAAGSDLGTAGGIVELIQPLIFVDTITAVAPTTGGVDEELMDDYLTRLRAHRALATRTPILPADFSLLAQEVVGAYRAVTIDGYNPADSTYGNERMITVAAIDSAGAAVSTSVKSAIQAYLDGLREISFIVNTMNPNFTNIAVVTTVVKTANADSAQVQTDVAAAITNYLSPLLWGSPPSNFVMEGTVPPWTDKTVVRRNELMAAIGAVQGVAYVSTLTINGGTVDVNLTAPAALPNLTPAPTVTVT